MFATPILVTAQQHRHRPRMTRADFAFSRLVDGLTSDFDIRFGMAIARARMAAESRAYRPSTTSGAKTRQSLGAIGIRSEVHSSRMSASDRRDAEALRVAKVLGIARPRRAA